MNSSKKLFIIYPLMVIMILGGMFSITSDYSFAAESFDVSHGTKWVQGENIDSGLRIKTKDGKVAYCLNQGSASPSGAYTDTMNLTSKLKAVLYNGYPNNKTFGSVTLTADQARCATQLAVWAHDTSSKGNRIDLDKLHGAYDQKPDGDNVLKAAKWLYNKADSGYSAPSVPTFPAPTISKPSDNTPQFYNETYVRIGPYKFTTTNNSYTSGNKATVNLGNTPTGTRLGNASGGFISSPTAGTNFYIYVPSSALKQKGSGSFSMNISYNYKYEKAAEFTAYRKDSTQNVAISSEKEFAEGSKSTNGTGDFKWTTGKLTKVDSEDKNKVIADTEFDVFYDPTPANTSNNDWKLMYKMKTDGKGIISIPGLGIGTYKLVETKPNPEYAFNSESGGSDEIIFKITDVSTESIQVMTNDVINISCQVDKDTIKQTSAAYKSLPDQENFDNTGKETYRYHVDYRSTANVWSDEFTVDDPLEGVGNDQIRVTELWTPICHGDYDKKMNLWYKTNKTDDQTDYSDVCAISSNPVSPNNPNKESVRKNTGYKLWEQNIRTDERRHLYVSDLGLDEDEYITAIRLEHGRVEKGFTTRNYAYESMNDDSIEDWTPGEDDQFYTKESADAVGLKPLTYLVMCPNPLSPPEIIENSAEAFIARNINLTDDDDDIVYTEVIDTFKEEPIDEDIKGETTPKNNKSLGEFEEVKGVEAKTSDTFKIGIIMFLMIAAAVILLIIRKRKSKMLSLLLAAILLTGTFATFDESFAGTAQIKDSFTRNGLEYSLVNAVKADLGSESMIYDVKYEVKQNIDSKKFDKAGPQKMLPQSLDVNVNEYGGKVTLDVKSIKPIYLKKQAQIDKVEVIKDLEIEDISALPNSKVYEIRSDKAVNATVSKELKRAGINLKISDYDSNGVPCKWDATVVYRGLETYLEKYRYDVEATYSGRISSEEQVRKPVAVEKKDYNDLNVKEAKKKNKELAKEKYMQLKSDESPKMPVKELPEDSGGWQTSDLIKFLGLLAAMTVLSFVVFLILTRRRREQ